MNKFQEILNQFFSNTLIMGSMCYLVNIIILFMVTLDNTTVLLWKVLWMILSSSLSLYTLTFLKEEQTSDQITLMEQARIDLMQQATVPDIKEPTKEETIQKLTEYASWQQDPTGIAGAIQKVLDSMGVATAFHGIIQAPRFQRVQLVKFLGGSLPAYSRLSQELFTGLVQFALPKEPIVSIEKGLLTIDIPLKEFKPVTYSQVIPQVQGIIQSGSIPIGLNQNYEIVSQPVNQFNAFVVGGGKTRSGKSNFLTQTCIQLLLHNPSAKAYCIEFKENTFKMLEGCEQIHQKKVAYNPFAASSYINHLHQELMKRIDTGRLLKGEDYSRWKEGLQPLFLFFDEYKDDPIYTPMLDNICSKGSAYSIYGFFFTQSLNKSAKGGGATVSDGILRNSKAALCFLVRDNYNSIQILGESGGENLLGFGDLLYKSDNNLEIQRLQTILYEEDEIKQLCRGLKFSEVAPLIPASEPDPWEESTPLQEESTIEEEPEVPEIIPPTLGWRILEFLEKQSGVVSAETIARGLAGMSRRKPEVVEELENLIEEGAVYETQSRNGLGKNYGIVK